jgi:hypothetical protein
MEMASSVGRFLFSALGGRHPIRLFVGISCSCAAKFIVHVMAKTHLEAPIWSAMDDFSTWYFILFIAPLFFILIVVGRNGALEATIHQANTIRMLLDEAGIKGARRQAVWNLFIERYIRALTSGTLTSPDLTQVFDNTFKELSGAVPSLEQQVVSADLGTG